MLKTLDLKYSKFVQLIATLLFGSYILCVLYLCFYPQTADLSTAATGRVTFHVLGQAPVILEPFTEFYDISFYLNILMTIPAGCFIILLFQKYLGSAELLVLSIGIGALIEGTQFLLDNLGLMTRFVDINDVIANMAGVLLGYLLAELFGRTARYFLK